MRARMRDDWRQTYHASGIFCRRTSTYGGVRAGVIHALHKVGTADATKPHSIRREIPTAGSNQSPGIRIHAADASAADATCTADASDRETIA